MTKSLLVINQLTENITTNINNDNPYSIMIKYKINKKESLYSLHINSDRNKRPRSKTIEIERMATDVTSCGDIMNDGRNRGNRLHLIVTSENVSSVLNVWLWLRNKCWFSHFAINMLNNPVIFIQVIHTSSYQLKH